MMTGKLITQCILRGLCACLVYQYDKKADVCFGPVPSYQQLSSRTDYTTTVKTYAGDSSLPLNIPDGCQPTLFYNFQRHTIRFPAAEDFNASAEFLPDIQDSLKHNKDESEMCKHDVQAILKWKQPFEERLAQEISNAGRTAVRQQVRRLRQRFPSIFNNRQPNENLVVDYTSRGNRTRETAEVYLREWFGDEVFDRFINERLNTVNPSVNQFDEDCKKIMDVSNLSVKLDNNIVISSEAAEQLKESKTYKQLKDVISKRLGFKVKNKPMKTMLKQCQYEVSNLGSSPWCAVFGENEQRLLELAKDVKDYDIDGYGTYMNENMACPVAVDMLDYIKKLNESDEKIPKVVLHFSHSEAFKKLAPLFGIGREQPSACEDRTWRISRISPFNTNLNVVYYKCSAQQDRVAVLLNEKMEKLHFCQDTLCTADEFTKYLESKANGCDLETICSKA